MSFKYSHYYYCRCNSNWKIIFRQIDSGIPDDKSYYSSTSSALSSASEEVRQNQNQGKNMSSTTLDILEDKLELE